MENLINVLCEYNDCNVQELGAHLESKPEFNNNLVNHLLLATSFLGSEDFVLDGDFNFTKENPRDLRIYNGVAGPTVNDLYLKNGITLKYPKLPLLAVKWGGTHLTFYPLELLQGTEVKQKKIYKVQLIFHTFKIF